MKDTVLARFEALSRIPRPSGHEEKAAAFVQDWAESHGFSVSVDEWNNVIAEVPAAPGYENAPLTILQGHLDMVCVAEEGRVFNRLTDPIVPVRETVDGEERLRANGTSLGGDDGIAIAVMMAIAEEAPIHGPLRLIATADEEAGMSGAVNLAKEALDAGYLINLDSEQFGELTNSSAGSQKIILSRSADWMDAPYPYGFTVRFSGFRGGHSGTDIHRDRCNPLWLLGQTLANVPAAIHSLTSGTVNNAIPDGMTVRLVTSDPDMLFRAVHWAYDQLQEYTDEPDTASVALIPASGLTRTLTPRTSADLLRMLAGLPCGVLDMSREAKDLVATSCNIGVARLNPEGISIQLLSRSSVPGGMARTLEAVRIRAMAHGFTMESSASGAIWPVQSDNPLEKLFCKIFREETGKELKVQPIHAGLEAAEFVSRQPGLYAVACGPTVHYVHTPREYMEIGTLEPFCRVLTRVLEQIAEE